MDDIYKKVGAVARERRLALGMTQEELGEATGLHPSYIGQIERGVKKASLATLSRLAAGLSLKPAALLEEPARSPATPWEARIDALLRDKPAHQKEILYSTLRHLSRELSVKK